MQACSEGKQKLTQTIRFSNALARTAKLDRKKYDVMLQMYYDKRGWDQRGIPTKKTLFKLGLQDVTQELAKHVQLTT
jgi:aldehyde:ferredoxin oxidoreductase